MSGWLEVSSVEMPASNQAVTPASIVGLWPVSTIRGDAAIRLLSERSGH